ncbi:hypothetical protein JTB14_000472 [Gonioctena quinquepunctata]|nr:hypothetical protein JTB14_000472 [Gonioctena quinquepunctata]
MIIKTNNEENMEEKSSSKSISTDMGIEGTKQYSEGLQMEFRLLHHGPRFGQRHVQICLLACLFFIYTCVKLSMAICVVAMTDPNTTLNKDIPTYNWTDKNIIIFSYLWGFTIPQTATGWLVNTYGPKWFLVGSMTFSSIMGLLIPISASTTGDIGVMVCRFLQGFTQALITSAAYAMAAKWFPISERSRMIAFMLGGISVGGVTSMFLSGFIAASWYGWPMVFYLYNGFGLIWSIIFCFYGRNGPADHLNISPEEKLFIETSLAQESKGNLSTPWLKILSSQCFWSLVLAHCAYFWGYLVLLSEIPIYIKHVMKFNIKSNGVLSSLPLIAKWITSYIASYIADFLINRKICDTGRTRKIMNTLSTLIPCIALILLGNSSPDQVHLCITLLVIAVGFTGASFSGVFVNFLDISPNHSATTYGMSSQVSMLFSCAGPFVVNFFVDNEENPEQWKNFFYSTCGIYAFTLLIYGLFGSGKVQKWNAEIQKDVV